MKIRNGFVSNSSSSSFVILSKEPLKKEDLIKFFKVPQDSPLRFLSEQIATGFIRHCKNQTWESLDEWYKEGFLEKMDQDELKNWSIYTGSISDDDGGIEGMLCDIDLNIVTDDIIIKKDGGY